MHFYFLLVRIAALFGHRKARAIVQAQREWKKGAWDEALKRAVGAVWVHAASVGEFEQARPLIERLRREHPQQKIVVTFFSPSGYEMRKTYDRADGVYYLPFATRRNARRWLDTLQPKMAVLVKYEFWPAYLRELKQRGIPAYSICAIFRPGQLFFRPWGKRHLSLLTCFTHIYVQDEASLSLLQAHAVGHATVAGDTRFDRMTEMIAANNGYPDPRMEVIRLFAAECSRVIVAGSTWPEDEALLAAYMRTAGEQSAAHSVKLILVPHEIDEAHMHYIFNLFEGRMVRYTDLAARGSHLLTAEGHLMENEMPDVLVVDTMGLLSRIYRVGQVAYIGGGFGVGIHNTIEAAAYGMPVLFGPNYAHFREAKGLIAARAARSVRNEAELTEALDTALDRHTELGANAAAYVASEVGATEKIYGEIFRNL